MPPQWRGSPHQSAKVSSLCLRAKDHLEGTRVAVFLRFCAHEKTSPATQRAGGHRRVAREDDGRPGYPRGAGDPEPADGGIRTECARRGHLSRRSLSFSRNLRAGELSEVTPGPASFEVYGSPACRSPSARQLTGPEGREWFSKLSGSLLCHPDLVARRVTLDAACCRLDDARSDVIITDSLRALGLSRSLRYPVRTGTRLRL